MPVHIAYRDDRKNCRVRSYFATIESANYDSATRNASRDVSYDPVRIAVERTYRVRT